MKHAKNPSGDPKLVRHLEKYLGKIEGGWSMTGGVCPVFIAKFADSPGEGAVTFATLGLSEATLHQIGGNAPDIRQELVFSMWATDDDESPVALMMAVVSDILESEHSLDHGQVLGPAGPILDGVKAEALYCTSPVYFDEDFQDYGDSSMVFVWLMPITREEAEFARANGPRAFEALLDEHEIDFLDLNRESVRLPRKRK